MAAGALTETVVEEVATNLEEAAVATRAINAKSVGVFAIGLGVGVAVGFYFGYRLNRAKIRAEAFEEAEETIEKIRDIYLQKTVAAQPKPAVEDIVEEKGYGATPEEVVEGLISEVKERPLPAPVPIIQEPFTPAGDAKRTADAEKDKNDGWSYPRELAKRTSTHPYIIHQDEFSTNETEFPQVNYTYYAGDDILADEHDGVLNNRETLIGVDSLSQFGHGSDDLNIVYIRNPHLELEIEVVRTPRSYEEEVQGLENSNDPDSD